MTATVDEVLAHLVTIWTAAAPSGWQVVDSGPPIDPALDFLCVGFDYSDHPAVTVTSDEGRARPLQDREVYDVTSVVGLWNGTEVAADARAAVLAAFRAFRGAVRADRTLGGLVTDALVSGYDLHQAVSPLGNTATVTFTTNISAF